MKVNKIYSFFLLLLFTFPLSAQVKDSVSTNKKVIEFVNKNIGKKVERGECWDLANKALLYANAKWDRKFNFGNQLDLKKDTILPGDIIQFSNVKIEYIENGKLYMQEMQQHTAVIYEVLNKHTFKIAQQNTGGRNGRKVSIGDLDLETIKKGKIKIYRPVSL